MKNAAKNAPVTRPAFAGAVLLACIAAVCAILIAPATAHAQNMDRYIGLDKKIVVLAITNGTNNQFKPIFAKASSKSKKINRIQGRSCLVVDTAKMKKGKDYKYVKVELPTCSPSTGYIRVKDFTFDTLNTRTFGLASGESHYTQRVVACQHSLKFLGAKYSNANSTSLYAGLNCRHIVLRSFNYAGHKVWTSRAYKMNKNSYGKVVTKDKLRPGDVVFYKGYNGRNYNHMGLYLGKGYVIQSTCDKSKHYPTGGVRITKLKFRSLPQIYRDMLG